MSPTENRFVVLAAIVALLSAAAGVSLWQLRQQGPPPTLQSLRLLPEPRALADFSLIDQDGQPFTLQRLQGGWSLLFFGFTHCPDVCPSTLYDLHRVSEALATEEAPGHLQVIFVSVDPERDSPQLLAEYVHYFDPAFLGVTGSAEQLAALALQVGIAFHVEPHAAGAETYSVDHSAGVLLTGPDGRLFGLFPAPLQAQSMAADLRAVMNQG
jgi:protein SCO1